MHYVVWALLALAAYSFVAPLMSVATTGNPRIPSNVAALISNSILVIATFVVILYSNESVAGYLTHPKSPYVYATGLFLAVGILSYYRALSLGPVSVVAPIFGLFLAVSSVLGILVLGESLTLRKGLGIALAALAVVLVSGE
jgi:transporter family protein